MLGAAKFGFPNMSGSPVMLSVMSENMWGDSPSETVEVAKRGDDAVIADVSEETSRSGRGPRGGGALNDRQVRRVISAQATVAGWDQATLKGVAGLLGVAPDVTEVTVAKLGGTSIPVQVFRRLDALAEAGDKLDAMVDVLGWLSVDDPVTAGVWRAACTVTALDAKMPSKPNPAAKALVNACYKLRQDKRDMLAGFRKALESI